MITFKYNLWKHAVKPFCLRWIAGYKHEVEYFAENGAERNAVGNIFHL